MSIFFTSKCPEQYIRSSHGRQATANLLNMFELVWLDKKVVGTWAKCALF